MTTPRRNVFQSIRETKQTLLKESGEALERLAVTMAGAEPGKLACGCHLSRSVKVGASEPILGIRFCPLHAAAGAMRERLQELFDLELDEAVETLPYPTKVKYRVSLDKARALLAGLEGGQ